MLSLNLINEALVDSLQTDANLMSRASGNRSSHPEDARAAAFSDKLAQEQKESKEQQKAFLGQELVKQLKEKEMMRNIQNENVCFSNHFGLEIETNTLK